METAAGRICPCRCNNNATQAKKAPGSTFKPITAIAGLEEKVIGLYETIDCTGEYKEVDPPIKCWIYPGHHGPLTVVGGLQNSCNYFFTGGGTPPGNESRHTGLFYRYGCGHDPPLRIHV